MSKGQQYRKGKSLTKWTRIGESTATWGGRKIIYLKSPGGAYRYPTPEELARDWKRVED